MAAVVDNLSALPDFDVQAIAAYMAGILGKPNEERQRETRKRVARSGPNGPGREPLRGDAERAQTAYWRR